MNKETCNQLSAYLKAIRLEKGMKQSDLAERTGLSACQISRLEASLSDLTVSSIIRIAKELDLSLENILTELGITSTFAKATNEVSFQNFGSFLREYRKSKKVTQQVLSGKIQASYKTLIRFEQSQTHRLSFTEIVSIDKALCADGELIAAAWREGERHLTRKE